MIFSGSIRSNLDPFGQAGSDGAIREALRQAGMDELVKGEVRTQECGAKKQNKLHIQEGSGAMYSCKLPAIAWQP